MRIKQATDGRSHNALTVGVNDHHPRPRQVTISNTSQSLPPGTTYDLDIDLGVAGYQRAHVMIMGPWQPTGPQWREAAEVVVTTDSAEAQGYSVRDTGSFKKSYAATYSKQNGDTNLTHKIFDSDVSGYDKRYIALLDAWITGSTLRLRFKNYFGGSKPLWVKGQAEVY